jgi:hypothetical protein
VSIRALALAVVFWATASQAAFAQLTVEGTEFVLTTGDGRMLRSADLVGATLMMDAGGEQTAVTLESVEEDSSSTGGDVFLHHFVIKDDSGNPKEFCSPDAQGRSLGFPVPDGNGGFELTCTSGAIGKCIRWGYRLWEEKPGGPPLRAMHEACVHMARADYGGDGATHTRDGTLIFFCDRFGIHSCEGEADGAMSFEAAWGTNGAVCVARPRIAELVTLQALAEKYSQLAPHIGSDVCTLEIAMRNSEALLFNKSKE